MDWFLKKDPLRDLLALACVQARCAALSTSPTSSSTAMPLRYMAAQARVYLKFFAGNVPDVEL